jgi:hypothetical protein
MHDTGEGMKVQRITTLFHSPIVLNQGDVLTMKFEGDCGGVYPTGFALNDRPLDISYEVKIEESESADDSPTIQVPNRNPSEQPTGTFEIWVPGCGCSPDDHGPPFKLGEGHGETFKDACCAFAAVDQAFAKGFDYKTMTFGGARLYSSAARAGQDFH